MRRLQKNLKNWSFKLNKYFRIIIASKSGKKAEDDKKDYKIILN